MNKHAVAGLVDCLRAGVISKREFVRRAREMGLSGSAISALMRSVEHARAALQAAGITDAEQEGGEGE